MKNDAEAERRMKIAFVVDSYPVASETFVVRQIAGFAERGHHVVVLAARYDEGADDPLKGQIELRIFRRKQGTAARIAHLARFGLSSLSTPEGRKRIGVAWRAATSGCRSTLFDLSGGGAMSHESFDAVIAHFGPLGVRAMYLRDAGYFEGPISTVFHGFDMSDEALVKRYLPHYKQLFGRGSLSLPVSEFWRMRLIDWGAPASRTLVHHVGVDVEQLPLATDKQKPGRPLKVLSVGRFVEKKGLEYAIAGVCDCSLPVEYNVIGYGPLEADLRAMAANNRNPVNFLGARAQDEVFAELKRTDVFLLPSVTAATGDMEGIPVSIMEAMATGAIVVATRHSGIPELVVDGETGVLVDERSGPSISAALEKIAKGQIDTDKMRATARHTIEANFNNRTLHAELEAILVEARAGEAREIAT